jgi:hypothetical protein
VTGRAQQVKQHGCVSFAGAVCSWQKRHRPGAQTQRPGRAQPLSRDRMAKRISFVGRSFRILEAVFFGEILQNDFNNAKRFQN